MALPFCTAANSMVVNLVVKRCGNEIFMFFIFDLILDSPIIDSQWKRIDFKKQMATIPQHTLIALLVIVILTIYIFQNVLNCPPSELKLNRNCQISLEESDYFVCESDEVWRQRKETFHKQNKVNSIRRKSGFFFFDNWLQNFHCSNAERIGTMGEGGKWVCDPFKFKSRPDCLIYSVGSNGEFSFEIEMKKLMPHCEIHTFDKDYHPYPNDTCIFHSIKFGNDDHTMNTRNWTSILKELNHTNRIIDLLKMDIEGDEYSFFPLIFVGPEISFPKQILVELHPQNDTTVHEFFEEMRRRGYVIFSKEENILAGPWFYEYSFLRLNQRFFL